MSHEFTRMKREAWWKIIGHSDVKKATKDATNSDEWGPKSEQLKGLAAACYVADDRAQVLHNLWKRLEKAEPKKWQKVVKALVVLDYVVLHGPEDVVLDVRRNSFRLEPLMEFKSETSKGDHGESVRQKARNLRELIKDDAKLKAARETAKRTSARIQGGSAATRTPDSGARAPRSADVPSRQRLSTESKMTPTGLSDEEVARRLQEQFNREAGVPVTEIAATSRLATKDGAGRAHGHSAVSADDEDDVLQQVMRISKMEAEAAERLRAETEAAQVATASVAAAAQNTAQSRGGYSGSHNAVSSSSSSSPSSPPPQQQQQQPVAPAAATASPVGEQQSLFAPRDPNALSAQAFDPFDPFAPASPAPAQQPVAPRTPQTLEDFFDQPSGGSVEAGGSQQQPVEPLPAPQLTVEAVPPAEPTDGSAEEAARKKQLSPLDQKMQNNIDMFATGAKPSSSSGSRTLAEMQQAGQGSINPSPTAQQQQQQQQQQGSLFDAPQQQQQPGAGANPFAEQQQPAASGGTSLFDQQQQQQQQPASKPSNDDLFNQMFS